MTVIRKYFWIIFIICIIIIILGGILYFSFYFHKTTIYCNSREKLTELTKMDFINVEITDIQYEFFNEKGIGNYTQLFIFLTEHDALEFKEYYFNDRGAGIYDPNLEYIPAGQIMELGKRGIEMHNILKHGGNYNEIRVGVQSVPFPVHWYQIDDSYDSTSNVILVLSIPRKVSVDVDKIIAHQ